MWELLPRKTRLLIVVSLSFYAAYAGSWVNEAITGVPIPLLKSVSIATGVVGLVAVGLFGLLWRRMWRLV